MSGEFSGFPILNNIIEHTDCDPISHLSCTNYCRYPFLMVLFCFLDSVTFVDLEFAGPNFRGFDLGDFFYGLAGECVYVPVFV